MPRSVDPKALAAVRGALEEGLSDQEAAARGGVTTRTLWNWREARLLPPRKESPQTLPAQVSSVVPSGMKEGNGGIDGSREGGVLEDHELREARKRASLSKVGVEKVEADIELLRGETERMKLEQDRRLLLQEARLNDPRARTRARRLEQLLMAELLRCKDHGTPVSVDWNARNAFCIGFHHQRAHGSGDCNCQVPMARDGWGEPWESGAAPYYEEEHDRLEREFRRGARERGRDLTEDQREQLEDLEAKAKSARRSHEERKRASKASWASEWLLGREEAAMFPDLAEPSVGCPYNFEGLVDRLP